MKRLALLFVMVLAVAGLHAQSKTDLPNVTIKDLNGKNVNIAKLSNDGKPLSSLSGPLGADLALKNTMPLMTFIPTGETKPA